MTLLAPTQEEAEKGVPEVRELWRDTFGDLMDPSALTPCPPLPARDGRAALRPLLRRIEPVVLLWIAAGRRAARSWWRSRWSSCVVVSFEAQETGDFTLSNYATAYGRAALSRCAGQLAAARRWPAPRISVGHRGADGLGGVAHRHAGQGASPGAWCFAAFVMPPYLGAIGWILLAGPNSGWLNTLWRALTGAEDPLFNVYSFSGLALVIALHSFPLVFMFVQVGARPRLVRDGGRRQHPRRRHLDGDAQGDAAAGLPAIVGSFILVFLETIALFGTPAIIGIPARINVVTTQLWQFFEYPVRVEVAAAYAMPLLLVTVVLIAAQKLLLPARASSRSPARAASGGRSSSARGAGCCSAWCAAGLPAVGGAAAGGAAAGGLRQGLGPGPLARQPDAGATTTCCCSSTTWR